ncbi:hypothetical protein [Bdellovibrio bacteriovorus]|uniref:Glutathionylspermidine synthase pre-ATP-grasp-like domain-containing protein n=1 Tax=Bdellovibrio bacteriovorus TaxID=959 RepID=A0A1Z3N4T3_BDEBC|nr:hypothetical protein [Bdellovibrio bacteriovorus]ASD62397.1 hypothetical protein B9G79_01865 [Bdellovibrio bacteriovorus]
MNLKADYIQQLRSSYKGLEKEPLEDIVSENLISPFTVALSPDVIQKAQKIISALYNMRQQPSYLQHYQSLIAEKGLKDPGNKSIMMSYDFHLDEHQNLKLIEVNTNAAFLILGYEMYRMKGHSLPVPDFNPEEIRRSIETEMELQGKKAGPGFKVAITDDAPFQQRLYVEFLAYNELFKSFGWDSRIVDYRELFKDFHPDFIYNRHTDFFLTEPSSSVLREKFLSRDACLSPNPFEYLMLADKQRLIDWGTPGFLESQGLTGEDLNLVRTAVPESFDISTERADEIWGNRKKFFFKPKNAFGSKQSYRGGTISRSTYDKIVGQDMIAQEYMPAPEQTFETPEGPQAFKYDLRCYAYQGRMQMVLARLYQGQVTNLRTTYGGFATVKL